MSNHDWLSLSEIARLWSDETGESAEALERDLEDWFAAFVERPTSQQSGSPGGAGNTTNVLMGLLGSRHLQRETFEIYCQEKGLDKPLFWFSDDNDDMQDEEPQAPPSWDWPGYDARQGPVGNAPESGPAASEPAAIPEPAGNDEPWPEDDALWQAAREAPPIVPARPGRMPLTVSRLGGLKSGRLAGGLALGLALMVAGYLLGQDAGGPSPTGPEAATPDPVPTAVESTLRSELVEARRQIDSLGAALEASDTEIRQLTKNLLTARQALDTAKRTAPLDAAPPSPRPGASDVSPDREISALKADLAAARQTIARLRETAAASQTGAVKQSLIQAATSASAQAMSFKASLDGAHQRIAELVREAQTARAEADALAAELDKVRRQQETPPRGIAAAAETSRQRLILATEIARTQAALSKQELAAALTRLVRLESEAETAKAEAARLTGELAETRRLRTAELDASAGEREGARRVPVLAAQAASVHAAKLDRDLHAAQRRIAELEAQAADADAAEAEAAGQLDDARTKNSVNLERLLAEAASRQEALDAARQRIARLEAAQPPPDTQVEGPAAESQEAARPTQAGRPVAPSLGPGEEAGQPVALLESDAARRVAVKAARPEPSAPPESIDVDSLVAEPGRYDARRVVVTGFLMRLLQHYRLQSESGVRTLVVDVDGLHRDQYELLQQAIADAGLIGSVRAQISGKVERGSETAFRLVASDLRLIE